ncbi:hypothetical protein ACF0H5_016859 [Mactra antiquata]
MSEQDLLREAIQSVDLMEFPTYYQQQPMYQPSQQTMIQPQPLIQPVQQTSGGSIQDKQIALAVLKELKEIKTLLYPLKDLCEMMAKKQQSCSVQFQAQEMKVPINNAINYDSFIILMGVKLYIATLVSLMNLSNW